MQPVHAQQQQQRQVWPIMRGAVLPVAIFKRTDPQNVFTSARHYKQFTLPVKLHFS
jgi:hypothetical protein